MVRAGERAAARERFIGIVPCTLPAPAGRPHGGGNVAPAASGRRVIGAPEPADAKLL